MLNKFAITLRKLALIILNVLHLNLQFIDKQNLDSFIYQEIVGLVGSVVAFVGREIDI